MKPVLWIFSVLLVASGWNHEGHKIASRVAASLLTRKTARFIKRFLHVSPVRPGVNRAVSALVSNGAWADFVPESLEWSRELHFSHTPYRACAPFVKARDCGFGGSGRCLVTAIANFTAQAADATVSDEIRADALRFLIHLVVDAHSPMHVGFAEDFGGNSINVLVDGSQTTLHEFWDSAVIEKTKTSVGARTHWAAIAQRILSSASSHSPDRILAGSLTVDTSEDFAAAIVSETATQVTCDLAYRAERGRWIKEGHSIGDRYLRRSEEVVLGQLHKAGVRLAQLLEVVAQAFYRSELQALVHTPVEMERVSANPFALLGLQLDLEDFVFEVENDAPAGAVSEAEFIEGVDDGINQAVVVTTTSLPPDEPVTALSPVDEAVTGLSPVDEVVTTLTPEHDATLERQDLPFGLEMDQIVLIKRHGVFYITHRANVTSDSYVPQRLVLLDVLFAGMDNPIPFRMDNDVFRGDYSDDRMRAVFEHLTGSVGLPVAPVAAVARSNGFPALRSGPRVEAGRATHRAVELSEVTGFIPKRPTMHELAAMYPRTPASRDQYAADVLRRQLDDVLMLPFNEVVLITTSKALRDRNQRRFVFNRFGVVGVGPAGFGSPANTFAYVDTRVLDEELNSPLLTMLEQKMSTAQAARQVRKLMAENPTPIVKAMGALARCYRTGFEDAAEAYLAGIVVSINKVVRPDRPELTTHQIILKA